MLIQKRARAAPRGSLIFILLCGQGVSLQLLPPHAGIAGNEAADRLADAANSLPASLTYPRDPRVIEGTLRLYLQEGKTEAYLKRPLLPLSGISRLEATTLLWP